MDHPPLDSFPSVSFHRPHSSWVFDVIQLKDGTLLSCADQTIKRWTVEGQLLNTFLDHAASVYCLMELDDNFFLSGSWETTMKVWNKTTGKCFHSISTARAVCCVLRLRNNFSFLCGLGDGTIEERRLDNFATLHIFKQHSNTVQSMFELSNGNVVSGSSDDTAKEWDMKTKTVVRTFAGHSDSVLWVIELRDKTIATASSDKTVRVWEETTGRCVRVLRGGSAVVELSDGTLLTGGDNTIREWNRDGECVRISTFAGDENLQCLRALKNGSIVLGDCVGNVRVQQTWLRYFVRGSFLWRRADVLFIVSRQDSSSCVAGCSGIAGPSSTSRRCRLNCARLSKELQ
jgi:WD40 repeat protein